MIEICKMGSSHKEMGINCQDAAIHIDSNFKMVCDGCSEGLHSEIGANLFCLQVSDDYSRRGNKTNSDMIKSVMYCLVDDLPNDDTIRKDYLSFTSLITIKDTNENIWKTYTCGDGYIILQDYGDNIEFVKLDCGEYPKYLVYNYIDPDRLKYYKSGVTLDEFIYDNFKNVGVASDGIRFVVDRDDDDSLKKEFIEILKSGKSLKMKLFINRNSKIFQDDVSIVF